MKYNIKGTGVDISDEIRSYVEKKLHVSEKFLQETSLHVDVELEYTPNQENKKYRAEFMVTFGGDVHRSEAGGNTLHEAIDIAAGDLSRDLSQLKKKRQHIFRRGAMRVKEYIRGFRSKI